MREVRVITRADDAGSLIGCNVAFMQVLAAGFIKNASIIAVGHHLDHAARLFAGEKGVCFGMHAALNMGASDYFKWRPLTGSDPGNGLVGADGYMPIKPHALKDTKPELETVFKEYDAQLDALTRAGFDIRYMDSHCFADSQLGFVGEAREWAGRKGLIYHFDFTGYNGAPSRSSVVPEVGEDNAAFLTKAYSELENGDYLMISHPSIYCGDIIAAAGEGVARARSKEANAFSDADFIRCALDSGVRPLRYDEAAPMSSESGTFW
ncbi:MAG: ChbG/HpnK family deacetylase [Oscillospiraceae bacterium]|nr:ChbG/HpnK family deacetylase [Oscillospiraceae bacterium]